MAQYTTAELLTDGLGNPIPQFLDTTDTTDSPEGTFKPLDEVQETSLTGSNVEKIKVVDALAISDTNNHDTQITLGPYSTIGFLVSNSLGQDMRFNMRDSNNATEIRAVSGSSANFDTTISSNSFIYFNVDETTSGFEGINKLPLNDVVLRLSCSTAPTGGSVSVWVLKQA